MQRFRTLAALALVIVGHQHGLAEDRNARDNALTGAEGRLKAIYEKREFAPATRAASGWFELRYRST